jgi:1-acyl-sn-glycerol-3-phosphate acyltransferase
MVHTLTLRRIAALFRLLAWPFVRWEFRGGACINDRGGWILSANHRSVFDFPHAVAGLDNWRHYARIMIASEFWQNPAYRWAVRAIDAIPVYRKTDPRGAFQAAIEALQSGDSICIMPEGGIHWDPDHPLALGRFKTGVSRLAVEAGAPILPIALVGGDRVWRSQTKLPVMRPFRRQVVLCWVADEPLWLSGDDHRANAAKLREVQQELVRRATAELQAIDPTYLPTAPA